MFAARPGYLDAMRRLLAAGADVNRRNPSGETALSWGIHHPNVISELIRHGANPNQLDGDRPVILAAIRSGRIESVKTLIQQGASVTWRDPWGGTPLSHAREQLFIWDGDQKKLIAVLKDAGAKE